MSQRNRVDGDAELRSHILTATRRCLSVKGFHDVTIDDICRAAQTRRNVVYRYFSNRDTVIDAEMRRGNLASLEALLVVARDSEGSGGTPLIDLLGGIFSAPTSYDTARFNLEWLAWAARNPTGLQGFLETRKEWREGLASVIRQGLADDVSEESVQAMTDLMLVLYYGLAAHVTLEDGNRDVEPLMNLLKYGWEGIIERVRAGAPVATPQKPRGGRKAVATGQ